MEEFIRYWDKVIQDWFCDKIDTEQQHYGDSLFYGCRNVYVDTAFMPASHVRLLADTGLSDRILFGTDVPINLLFFEGLSVTDYIKRSLSELKEVLLPEQYDRIISNQLYR